MPSKKTRTPFELDFFYHIYNRGVNKERIFANPDNYNHFLYLYQENISVYVETFAFCLITNHFHFLIRIKEDIDIKDFNRGLRTWLVKYVMYFNNQESRVGGLLTRPINRIKVHDIKYLKKLIHYIHMNPVKHGLTKSFQNYKYSSLNSILRGSGNIIAMPEVLELFNGSIEEFIEFHWKENKYYEMDKMFLE